MKKITFLSALVGIIMLFAVNVKADLIEFDGIATLGDPYTDQVGKYSGDHILYYIPLTVPAGVYGDDEDADGNTVSFADGYGTGIDYGDSPLDGPPMDMYVYFDIGDSTVDEIRFWFLDLDLGTDNDPDGFFETMKIMDTGTKLDGFYEEWFNDDGTAGNEINGIDGSTVTNLGGNNYEVVINGLNITSDTGDYWLHLQFEALSISHILPNGLPWEDGTRLRNTLEEIGVTMVTNAPIPEPATIALLGIGLAGLAGGAIRRRFRKQK